MNIRASLKWPFRIFVAACALLAIGLIWLGPDARVPLLVLVGCSGAFLGWSMYDQSRGLGAALAQRRAVWEARTGAVADGEDLHLMSDGQPLIVRVGRLGQAMTATVLTPLSETTTAFRFWPKGARRPSFDGHDPAVGGPRLSLLPALGTFFGGVIEVEGNEPVRIRRWLDGELLTALEAAARDHAPTFRGLTFDGRFLAVHWIGPLTDVPEDVLALSTPLWRPFVPRLPPASPATMH